MNGTRARDVRYYSRRANRRFNRNRVKPRPRAIIIRRRAITRRALVFRRDIQTPLLHPNAKLTVRSCAERRRPTDAVPPIRFCPSSSSTHARHFSSGRRCRGRTPKKTAVGWVFRHFSIIRRAPSTPGPLYSRVGLRIAEKIKPIPRLLLRTVWQPLDRNDENNTQ